MGWKRSGYGVDMGWSWDASAVDMGWIWGGSEVEAEWIWVGSEVDVGCKSPDTILGMSRRHFMPRANQLHAHSRV